MYIRIRICIYELGYVYTNSDIYIYELRYIYTNSDMYIQLGYVYLN